MEINLTDEEYLRLWIEIQKFPDYANMDIQPMSLEETNYWLHLYDEETNPFIDMENRE